MSTPTSYSENKVHDETKSVVEAIKIIENRNLMSIFWIFVSCSGIFNMIQYWPTNSANCVSLSLDFGPESCGILGFTVYVIQPLVYCGLLMSLLFINFDVIDANDDNPIEIKIENETDKKIQVKLKQSQSKVKLFRVMSIYYKDKDNEFSQELSGLSALSEASELSHSLSADDGNEDDDDIINLNYNESEAYDHDEYLWELIKEKSSKCEELLFPICILKALIIVEVFVVLYSPNLWYIIQIISDFAQYLLWLFYTAIITKLKLEHKIENSRTKVMNYIFLLMAIISLCIMTYKMLAKDLGFEALRNHGVPQLGFVQIILESTLLLELLSIVVENLLHIYCTCFHHSYHPINDAPDISHLLGHRRIISTFLLFGSSQIALGTAKALQNDESRICSNFTVLSHDSLSDCSGYFGIAQLCINMICFASISSLVPCRFHILSLELLVFPFIIFILMMLCEFMFALTSGNIFYFIQIFIDITGYAVLFCHGLYALRFFMYINVHSSWIGLKRGMDDNIKYMVGGVNNAFNVKLVLLFTGLVLCLLAAIVTLILNFYTDVAKIETSASYLAYVNNQGQEYQVGVEQWMFLQIVFENTLIVEYIRLLAKSIDIHYIIHND